MPIIRRNAVFFVKFCIRKKQSALLIFKNGGIIMS